MTYVCSYVCVYVCTCAPFTYVVTQRLHGCIVVTLEHRCKGSNVLSLRDQLVDEVLMRSNK